jgi:hypothetical protein
MTKRLFCTLLLLLGFVLPTVLPAPASAVNVFQACNNGAANTDVCRSRNSGGADPFTHALSVGLNILTFVVGLVAVVWLIYCGLKMMWAQGDAQAVKSAREGMIGAVVGLAVAAMAQVIVVFVLSKVQ